jgi:hypothetical protein
MISERVQIVIYYYLLVRRLDDRDRAKRSKFRKVKSAQQACSRSLTKGM